MSAEVPEDFRSWWCPHAVDEDTGASIGGHPDAFRVWSKVLYRGRVLTRQLGVSVEKAWLTKRYQDEYFAWVAVGRPARRSEFLSVTADNAEQKRFFDRLKPVLAKIGTPVPDSSISTGSSINK